MTSNTGEHLGRRSLRIGLVVVAAAIVVLIAVGLGAYFGAMRSESINAWLSREGAVTTVNATDQGAGYWTCGMHPWVILPEPGLCPICHMDLTPLDPSKLRGEIAIDPVVVHNIGVRIAPVTMGPLVQTVRTVGTIVHDERTVREINLRFEGWIEKLHVDFTGQHVHEGEALFDIYSPDLLTAQQDLLLAIGQPELERSSRERLANYGMTSAQIDDVIKRGSVSRAISYLSPVTGHVITKNVLEGMHVSPGTALYRIADHRHVWVNVAVYESQLPMIEVGTPALMRLPFLPNEVREGKVVFVQPHLDAQSRQLEVRLEFDNADLLLKPGMFATIELLPKAQSDVVLVPREAVITTGTRNIAFVSLGEGRFEPRDVKIGSSSDGQIQILEGLEPGEMVVTSGQFLLDSESRMREALAKMVTGNQASEQRPDVKAVDASEATQFPSDAQEHLAVLLRAYLEIGNTLSNDTTNGIASQARTISQSISAMKSLPPASNPHFWHEHADDVNTINARADALASNEDIGELRIDFGFLSDALDRIVAATGVPASLGEELDRRVCGMVSDVPRSGVWLQAGDADVRNPYFGAMMLRCNVPAEHRRLPPMASNDGPHSEDAP